MIMNEFMSRVQKEMITLRKKNMNFINEFKIEMFHGRKNIQKNIIKLEFGITQSESINENEVKRSRMMAQKQHVNIKLNDIQDKNMSTNHNSRAVESTSNETSQISRFTHNFNKENQDPNKRVNTDISIIDQFPAKHLLSVNCADISNQFDLKALKNDESIEINTEEVKKKYQKFMSASAGWTFSADRNKQVLDNKGENGDMHPFCTEFVHEGEQEDGLHEQSLKKDSFMFGFGQIDERNFSMAKTIKQTDEFEQSNNSNKN